ncbi:MAG: NUDIX hydrolase [Rhodobacteraceae bacterium]|nr:NUDIX hydrolase [Paracoccaceae bacterium]
MDKTAIRNAATVILVRNGNSNPLVLMGQRGHKAAFMPNKFVFPGGAVDTEDAQVALAQLPDKISMQRLAKNTDPALVQPLLLSAVREMWEETGHAMAVADASAPAIAEQQPDAWQGFFKQGWLPSAQGLTFIFRAITPPGRPRRFDARFFLGDADLIMGDPDDFSKASDELSHLKWIPLQETRSYDLPFVTEVVLAEVQARLNNPQIDHGVPFFSHDGGRSQFLRL